jgi:hypothetical protein
VVVPNRHIDLVPNIGVIGGTRSVLIVETGLERVPWIMGLDLVARSGLTPDPRCPGT